MKKWQLVMDAKVERGSKSCSLLVQRRTREQTLDCNQVLGGGWLVLSIQLILLMREHFSCCLLSEVW